MILPRICWHIFGNTATVILPRMANDLKIILVEEERSIITTMVFNGYKHFTVQLCYKILRHERWVGTPSQNWGNVPFKKEHTFDDW
jgi:hypothetical protein